ncbi:hypothetical protein KGQ20_04090 [Catenulispora sp. NF23]|uniref:DUF4377 domain-containing protein n=1 Tax=Catenulispora pinistramenti TaxID=2705254 RepID=A0ABS5KIJ5_9ACTN|nr:hypothetical protein [Catenulispora pinistramenti]MBS2531944.1 hypothetical protein [Catenulispora pinistramenti]MBS2546211.1 hypothetical protein [Catenulispora pinistramenti]
MAEEPITRRQRWIIGLIVVATVILTLAAIALGYKAIQQHRAATQATVTITVQDKRADCTAATPPSCTYTIVSDAGIFADHDEITAHKLNSQGLFDQLMYGGVYEVEIRGARHDSLGSYPNIIKIVRVIAPGHPNPAVVIAPATP